MNKVKVKYSDLLKSHTKYVQRRDEDNRGVSSSYDRIPSLERIIEILKYALDVELDRRSSSDQRKKERRKDGTIDDQK